MHQGRAAEGVWQLPSAHQVAMHQGLAPGGSAAGTATTTGSSQGGVDVMPIVLASVVLLIAVAAVALMLATRSRTRRSPQPGSAIQL
jgi:hypothetical protein